MSSLTIVQVLYMRLLGAMNVHTLSCNIFLHIDWLSVVLAVLLSVLLHFVSLFFS
jgi:hypothetical protein